MSVCSNYPWNVVFFIKKVRFLITRLVDLLYVRTDSSRLTELWLAFFLVCARLGGRDLDLHKNVQKLTL